MKTVLARRFFVFAFVLTLCVTALWYALEFRDRALDRSDRWVNHTHFIISEAEELATYVEGMVASQRGFILTGQQQFRNEYEFKKAGVIKNIDALNALIGDNKSQFARINTLRNSFDAFSKKLEERAARFAPPTISQDFLKDLQTINNLEKAILHTNSEILKEEYNLLNWRVQAVEKRKDQYVWTLLAGIIAVSIILFLLNDFFMKIQTKRSAAERFLKDTEERFILAVEGTNDGIFDWDLKMGKVFYTSQFFKMLGYDRDASNGTIEDFKNLVHPDEIEQVWQYMELYLRRELSEYSNTFRLQHKTGRWVWVHSRAKAIFDAGGNALRMVGANTDITHIKEYQERLKEEKESAEYANRAKRDFLAHMSHEIRTPLTAISGIAEIFMRGQDNLTDKQKKLIRTLNSSTSSLRDLVVDILDFSKIESGEIEIMKEPFSLGAVFQQVISIMAVNAAEKGLGFSFDYESLKDKEFWGDTVRLRQILINLIGNAIKFTEGGKIEIKAEKRDLKGQPVLAISVKDTGIGIDAEFHEAIFERFRQADSSISRKYGGTGLGLPISRNLARLMGGDIQLESEAGKGSCFTVFLPFAAIESEEVQKFDSALNKKLSDQIRTGLDGEKRALVVEDYEGNIVVVTYILDDVGCSYDIAKTGQKGIDLWKQKHYDFILMDVQLPEMDGFTATAEIRKLEQEKNMPRTPIIGLTAHALVGDKNKCIEAGMDAYLPKPINEIDLKTYILRFMSAKKSQLKKTA